MRTPLPAAAPAATSPNGRWRLCGRSRIFVHRIVSRRGLSRPSCRHVVPVCGPVRASLRLLDLGRRSCTNVSLTGQAAQDEIRSRLSIDFLNLLQFAWQIRLPNWLEESFYLG